MKLKIVAGLLVFATCLFHRTDGQEFESVVGGGDDTDDSRLPPLVSLLPTIPQTTCNSDGIVCPLTIDNVLDIDSNSFVETSSGCQYMCFREQLCQNFTFFQNSAGETRKVSQFKKWQFPASFCLLSSSPYQYLH